MFAIPIKNKSLVATWVPLAYSDIARADSIRTKALGLSGIPFRTHLRRKGGASDLFDANVPLTDIKVIGH